MMNLAVKQGGETYSFCDHARNVLEAIQLGHWDKLEYHGRNEYVSVDDSGLVAFDNDSEKQEILSFQTYCDISDFHLNIDRGVVIEINSIEDMKNELINRGFDVNPSF